MEKLYGDLIMCIITEFIQGLVNQLLCFNKLKLIIIKIEKIVVGVITFTAFRPIHSEKFSAFHGDQRKYNGSKGENRAD